MSLAKQLATSQGRLAEIGDEIEAVGAVAESEGRDLTDADHKQIQALSDESTTLSANIDGLKKAVEAKASIEKARLTPQLIQQQDSQNPGISAVNSRLPAKVRRVRSKYFENTYDAYVSGMWLAATFARRPEAIQFCRDNGIGHFRGAMEGGTDTLGGFSVPDPMLATIIELFESWGVFPQYARNVTMTSDTLDVPKLDAGLTVYYPGEGEPITASDLTFAQVNLVAYKMAALGILSTELSEDSVISVVDLLVRDIARRFAYHVDRDSFNGDGTATYGGVTGIKNALQPGAQVTAPAGGWGSVTLGHYQQMAGKLKEYGGLMPRWFMSRYAYYNSVLDLLNTAGGTDMRQIEAGGELMFLGYPVTFTQVLTGETVANGDLGAVLGDLDLGAYRGTRRQVSIRTLNELYAANDQIGVIGTMRGDTQIHSVGDATDAGAIVGLYLTNV